MAAAVEKAYAAIRDGIMGGTYPAGSHLKAEDLAVAVGVSRTPVREALRRLHAEGLVDFVANRGAYVLSWDKSDVDEVFGLRLVLESFGCELAATRRTPEQLAQLRHLADRMTAAARERKLHYLETIAELNAEFHKIIHVASGIKRLGPILLTVIQIPLTMRTFNRYSDEDLERSMAHHREIVAAFEVRDSRWAGAVMRSHIVAAHHVFLGNLNELGAAGDAA
ncbi:MAG TPA: GntR family transcriptional regulator [Xanthobacteraceae bacterium]|nr:GntR family transcriptional regulator [Xanthobacteraceae bacterium]